MMNQTRLRQNKEMRQRRRKKAAKAAARRYDNRAGKKEDRVTVQMMHGLLSDRLKNKWMPRILKRMLDKEEEHERRREIRDGDQQPVSTDQDAGSASEEA